MSLSILSRSQPATLVIGSDGFIGGALMQRLRSAGKGVLGSTRRPESVDESHLYLDLSEDVTGWTSPCPVDVAVFCAGVAKIELCRRDPVKTARINVENTFYLMRRLVEKGVFVIYLSTNQVFDGSQPYQRTEDPPSPGTEYGRQKAEVERRIRELGDAAAIVRLTKVLGPGSPPFSEWVDALQRERVIHPFSDMRMAPIPLSCAVSVIHLVGERRIPGILHVSGAYDISYAEAACRGAKLLGVDSRYVEPVLASGWGWDPSLLPLHTTLNGDRLKSVLGMEPPDVWGTIERIFLKPQLLCEDERRWSHASEGSRSL